MVCTREDLSSYLQSQKQQAASLLCDLIAHHSTVGQEQDVQAFLFDYLKGLGYAPDYASVDEDIVNDPEYTLVPGHKGYQGRSNILVNLKGSGDGRSLIVNSHSDVVPAPDNMFTPKYEDGVVYGRGACDAKGQVLTILLALKAMKDLGIQLKGDLQAQLVIEEESGGNGALSVIRQGHKADAALILEPTGLGVYPANRGAVWFKLAVEGRAAHMGKYYEGVNAIQEMVDLINILRGYDKKLYEASKGHPLFPSEPLPVCVNIGQIQGGDWPATVAAHCWIEGGIGFLPNKRLHQIRDGVRQEIEAKASEWAKQNYTLEFSRLHNDAYETPIDHPSVTTMVDVANSVRGAQPPLGWLASCDARLFYHVGQMPCVVFGPGELAYAHSLREQINVSDILRAAEITTLYLMNWCGV